VFGEQELQGMKLFLRRADNEQRGGNCASCHAAPHFSDFAFHNTGLTQQNYDQIHGVDAFVNLKIPSLRKRNTNYNDYLPATEKHPQASSRFRSLHSKNRPGYTDLGLWNVFANPDMPGPQQKLKAVLCKQVKETVNNDCSNESLLPMTVAAFKTPVLRDLGHSSPYMHTGQFVSLQQAVAMYINSSALAKAGRLRNADSALQHIQLAENDVSDLVAFLQSLNEDYD
jgi:cytochrome c peroxidase